MALIVEGKMPTCCGFCCECLGGGSDAYYCNRAKRQTSEVVPPYDKRMEWCPIIGEIPDKHGDLKDANIIMQWLNLKADNRVPVTVGEIIDFIEKQPTVLEATE